MARSIYATVTNSKCTGHYALFRNAFADLIWGTHDLSDEIRFSLEKCRIEKRLNGDVIGSLGFGQALAFGERVGLIKEGKLIHTALEPDEVTVVEAFTRAMEISRYA